MGKISSCFMRATLTAVSVSPIVARTMNASAEEIAKLRRSKSRSVEMAAVSEFW